MYIAHHRRPSRAFTLVELLVVIGIIALLISILLPALGRARESAMAVNCMSNMRQLSVSFMHYVNEQNGFLPAIGPSQTFWAVKVYPYTGMDPEAARTFAAFRTHDPNSPPRSIFICPTNKIQKITPPAPDLPDPIVWSGNTSWTYSYAMNAVLGVWRFGNGTAIVNDEPVRQSSIRNASDTMIVAESAFWWVSTHRYLNPNVHYALIPHRGGGNFLFADGHVAYLRRSDVPGFGGPESVARRLNFWTGLREEDL
jgi:prepilin-type processing-associated H-X9-DG protein/prepilin-type N-terminal cleavage/methylation domain-containing protein